MTLVTGGTGFIGSRITRSLLQRGEGVVCFDARPDVARLGDAARLADVAGQQLLRLVEGDIVDLESLSAAIQQHGVRRIIHTAAVLTVPCETDPGLGVRVNVVGTTNVFEAARAAGVERVVYASSLVVHGNQWDHDGRMLTENAPLVPHTFYADTKVMNERTAAAYAKAFGLDCRGLRIGAPFGPGGQTGRPGAEVTRLCALAAIGTPITIQLGRAESPPSTYVDDIAEILIRLSAAPRHNLTLPVYLCSVATVAMEDVARMVQTLLPRADIGFADQGPKVTLPYRIDASRLETDIDYRLPPLQARLRDHINVVRRLNGLPEA
jgi:UDP-glucose 4-epimerase